MDDYGLPDTASKESIFASFDDYKYNYKAGYDVSDSSFMFITKGGKFLSADEFRDLPKINPKNIIYVEEQNAAQNRIWYDNSRKEYKETVEKLTGYKLL